MSTCFRRSVTRIGVENVLETRDQGAVTSPVRDRCHVGPSSLELTQNLPYPSGVLRCWSLPPTPLSLGSAGLIDTQVPLLFVSAREKIKATQGWTLRVLVEWWVWPTWTGQGSAVCVAMNNRGKQAFLHQSEQ